MPSLVQPLFLGPLDIVGDVHGEIEALESLLRHLGYGETGRHPDGRKLVFLGDLTDRGPDSPAVIDLIASLIDSGRAQCVLGNHDLNILLDHKKSENRWFRGEHYFDSQGRHGPQRLADEAIQRRVLSLYRRLPIALERDDLRVIHACWNDEMIAMAREHTDVTQLYEDYYQRIESEHDQGLDEIDRGLRHQNLNPVKLLTSGPEERIAIPEISGDKQRSERRVIWWNDYKHALCVFGHYSISDGKPRGTGSSFCVDFGVGQRWKERLQGRSSGFSFRLGALRHPEWRVVFDDGEQRQLLRP